MVASERDFHGAKQRLQCVGKFEQIRQEHVEFIIVDLADGPDQTFRQDFDLGGRGKKVGAVPSIERQFVGYLMLGQESLQVATAAVVVLQQQSDTAGPQSI